MFHPLQWHPKINFVPGLYKIFDEILVNACDNFQRDPDHMTYIKAEPLQILGNKDAGGSPDLVLFAFSWFLRLLISGLKVDSFSLWLCGGEHQWRGRMGLCREQWLHIACWDSQGLPNTSNRRSPSCFNYSNEARTCLKLRASTWKPLSNLSRFVSRSTRCMCLRWCLTSVEPIWCLLHAQVAGLHSKHVI